MTPTITRSSRSRRASTAALTLGSCLLLAVTACADAESRDAPDDAQESAATQRAEEWAGESAAMEQGAAEEPTTEAPVPPAGQPATIQPDREAAQRTLPAGTSMVFTVEQTVSTGDSDVGDTFTANLRSDVAGPDGSTLIPAGTPSRWTIQESSTEGGQTVLAAQLESIQVNGEWRSVPARVVDAEMQTDSAATASETAAKIGVGTAAGALIGQILGEDTESTLKGAGVGAAVGTAVALATRGGSATLPEGSALTVELTEPLTVAP